ncbi:TPA: glycosyltransferase family 1 protein [Candidatus Daviesbacteria bacterium]|nr:glycosyltransferase family 1 protein [Candidatus Daviesbacteria bacterium]HCB22386.1 glycosyltransferase family 1 protein [Candidatus Daviesbacteria bacterium]
MVYNLKMIIGFDGSRVFIKNRSGTENYSYQLLQALSKIDHKNKYIVYIKDTRYKIQDTNWPSNFQFREIKWSRLWTQGGLALRTFKDKLDVLFVPAHTLPVIRRPGLKTVVTVHDLGSEYLPQMHQIKQRLYLSIMQKYQLKTATRIIAVSKATKDDLIKKIGLKPHKITVAYEGYDSSKFKVLASRSGQSSKFKSDYFLFVGTVQPRKNLERIITAFSRQSSVVRLFIAGSKGWLSDEIYELPKKLGIEKRVKFLGYVPDEKLPELYSGALALIFPSLFEGFGLPILEAQACSCPVITSNVSSMPEVAGKGAILINPYDIADIVKGMIKINNQDTRNKLIKAGFENIKRFNWEKCARETLNVLESV